MPTLVRRPLLLAVLVALAAASPAQQVRLVPAQYPTIQRAIDAAQTGDTVWVASGRYYENIFFRGKAIRVASMGGPGETIIDGSGNQVVGIDNGTLEGFTITNGASGIGINGPGWIKNNVIAGNKNAGVRDWQVFSTATLVNNTITNNGGGIVMSPTPVSGVVVYNCIVWGNPGTLPGIQAPPANIAVRNCNVEGGWPGYGNIDVDPQFVSPAQRDYHLLATSPCRNAGSASHPGTLTHDWENDPRPAFGPIDIGADQFHQHLYVSGTVRPGTKPFVKVVANPGASVLLGVGAQAATTPLRFPGIGGSLALAPAAGIAVIALPPAVVGGVSYLQVGLPPTFPKLRVPMQALVTEPSGSAFTNLFWFDVQ